VVRGCDVLSILQISLVPLLKDQYRVRPDEVGRTRRGINPDNWIELWQRNILIKRRLSDSETVHKSHCWIEIKTA